MNFCPQCGTSLEGVRDECPSCAHSIDGMGLKEEITADKKWKVLAIGYTEIVNLINLMQNNFYLVFIFTVLLFIVFSIVPSWGWGILLSSLLGAYWFSNNKTTQSLIWNQNIESWFENQVKSVPDKIDELDNYTQQISQGARQFYHLTRNKAQIQMETMKESYNQRGNQNHLKVDSKVESLLPHDDLTGEISDLQSNQGISETSSLRRRRRLQSQARTKQIMKNHHDDIKLESNNDLNVSVNHQSIHFFVTYLILISLSLFIYYKGIYDYSLFDFNASVLLESYQQTTFTMSNVIEGLGYGALLDRSGKSETLEIIFTIIAYYFPIALGVLSLLRSRIGALLQFIISLVMGVSMLYLIYLAMDANLFVRYGNDYGSFSTDLGLGTFMILGSIILMMVCSLYKMFKA